jgi:FKBP-type peptidyl-prolyl cis-trans isomerase
VGTGPEAKVGDHVEVHYIGTFKDGRKFDSSFDHPGMQPIDFVIGAGGIIQGWYLGIAGTDESFNTTKIEPMKVGGKRKLSIPASLAYGRRGKGDIPPDTDLYFQIQLVKIR